MESKMVEVNKEKPYPKLMINKAKDIVVLFSKSGCGQVVYSTSLAFTVGEYSDGWRDSYYEDFHGTITLTA